MSGIEDCTSEEIDVSTSSISTRNSNKRSFLKSILNTEDDRLLPTRGKNNIVLGERASKLPLDEKRDFIENWILSHNEDSFRNVPERWCPTSPVLGLKREKRLAESPILNCSWKRSRKILDVKNNMGVCLNTSRLKRNNNITRRFEPTVQHKNSRTPESKRFEDLDSTFTASNGPTLSINMSPLTLIVNGESRSLSWTTEKKHETVTEADPVKKVKKHQQVDGMSEIRRGISKIPSKSIGETETKYQNEGTCKFLWHKGKNMEVRRSLQFVGKCKNERISPDLSNALSPEVKNKYSRDSRHEWYVDNGSGTSSMNNCLGIENSLAVKQEETSPVRWKGYYARVCNSSELTGIQMLNSQQIKPEQIVIDSSSSDDWKENFTTHNRNTLLNVKCEQESPLRWNYRRSQIRDNVCLPETLSLSLPLTATNQTTPKSSFVNNPKTNLNNDHQNKNPWLEKKENLIKFEEDSLLRWNGYGNQTCEAGKELDTLSVTSPLIDTEQMITESSSNDNLQENFHVDNLSRASWGSSSLMRRNTFLKIEEKSSSTCNRYGSKTCNSLMLQDAPSLSSPVMKTEEMVRESTSTSDSEEKFNVDNRSQLNCHNYSLPSKNSFVKEENSSLNWVEGELQGILSAKRNGHQTQIRNFPILPETISFSPLIDEELLAVKKEKSDWENPTNCHSGSTLKPKNRREGLSPQLPETECIDEESCPSYGPDDDIKIESDSEATVSDGIENIRTQSLEFPETRNETAIFESRHIDKLQEKFIQQEPQPENNESYDSDETYCSNAEPMQQLRPEVNVEVPEVFQKTSQLISQLTTNSRDSTEDSANKSNTVISEASSPRGNNSRVLEYLPGVHATNNAKKKKAKKDTLVAKLQSLVKLQKSDLKIWQYQMTHSNLRSSSMQFVTMRIRKSAMRYGRYFLIAEMIEDTYRLFNNLFDLDVNSTNSKHLTQVITLMIIPEINGTIEIQDNSTIKIYAPWEVIDKYRRVLNIIYFEMSSRSGVNNDFSVKNLPSSRVEKIIEKFDCPCIKQNTLHDTCNVKFSNEKPTVMQAIFDS